MEAVLIVVTAALALAGLDALRAREAALRVARAACARYQVQLLDETVVCVRTRFGRGVTGRLNLHRTYRFEFTDDSGERRTGTLRFLGRQVEHLSLDLGTHTLYDQ